MAVPVFNVARQRCECSRGGPDDTDLKALCGCIWQLEMSVHIPEWRQNAARKITKRRGFFKRNCSFWIFSAENDLMWAKSGKYFCCSREDTKESKPEDVTPQRSRGAAEHKVLFDAKQIFESLHQCCTQAFMAVSLPSGLNLYQNEIVRLNVGLLVLSLQYKLNLLISRHPWNVAFDPLGGLGSEVWNHRFI